MKINQVRLILEYASELYQKAGDVELASAIQHLSKALKKADNKEIAALAKTLREFHQIK